MDAVSFDILARQELAMCIRASDPVSAPIESRIHVRRATTSVGDAINTAVTTGAAE